MVDLLIGTPRHHSNSNPQTGFPRGGYQQTVPASAMQEELREEYAPLGCFYGRIEKAAAHYSRWESVSSTIRPATSSAGGW
jgi:hypothetical protein